MTEQMMTAILKDTFLTMLAIVGPVVLLSLVIGFTISIFQATTQIQEQTLTFVPKLFSVIAAISLSSPYWMNQLISFFNRISEYIVAIS